MEEQNEYTKKLLLEPPTKGKVWVWSQAIGEYYEFDAGTVDE